MRVDDLQVFLTVAELGSITATGKQLNVSSSAASIAIKRLEQKLGAELLVRTTRQLRLTPEGERFLPMCQQALELLKQGQMEIHEEQQTLKSDVKMAMSSEMGRNLMRMLLNDFMEAHPSVSFSLHVSDSRVDFFRDGVDVALRAMSQEAAQESNLYGFKICNIPHVVCASPEYLKRHPTPTSIEELQHHNALLYKLYDSIHDTWYFQKDGATHKAKMSGDRAVNDGDIVRKWCLDGVGVAKKSTIDVAEDLLAGRLVRIMPDYKVSLTQLWMALPSRQLITPAIRLLQTELKKRIYALRDQIIEKRILTKKEWPLD